ncbi:uncharacterized protein TNCV_943921 [Trichonephila clavipes]|nr:uncharacterized protein TNCV_943921 [Trichonephila clavipes]
MYPLYVTVGSSGQGIVLPQEDRVARGHYREGRPLFSAYGYGASYSVWYHNELLETGYLKDSSEPDAQERVFHCLQVIAVCDACGVKTELIAGRNGDLLCFLLKAGSALVPVMTVCWSEGGQGNAYNQTVHSLDTLDQHLELCYTRAFGDGSRNFEPRQVTRTAPELAPAPSPNYSIQGRVLDQDNDHPHVSVLTLRALQSVGMLPCPARSPDLSPIEHV